MVTILQTVFAKSENDPKTGVLHHTDYDLLLNKLSFSHFIELLKIDIPLKRSFYEIEIIKNNWSVRELQRAMTLVKYATSGLSQKVFVSKYLINLPSEEQLREIIEREQEKIQK